MTQKLILHISTISKDNRFQKFDPKSLEFLWQVSV